MIEVQRTLRCGQGFTLIELMVVVVIITILVVLLLSGVKIVRAAAKSSNCKSNLRQLSMANISYSTDWEGSFVPGFWLPGTGKQWMYNSDFKSRFDYVNTSSSDQSVQIKITCPVVNDIRHDGLIRYSYGMNFLQGETGFSDHNDPSGHICSVRNFRVPSPVECWMFLDALDPFPMYTGSLYTGELPNGANDIKAPRHSGTANIIFYDGHVESWTQSNMMSQSATSNFWVVRR
jgi:prepilin-type N-terminal cleavage/methylation domain-containing protein/prepilin-type processing-associated H-X9-DG protein